MINCEMGYLDSTKTKKFFPPGFWRRWLVLGWMRDFKVISWFLYLISTIFYHLKNPQNYVQYFSLKVFSLKKKNGSMKIAGFNKLIIESFCTEGLYCGLKIEIIIIFMLSVVVEKADLSLV